MTAPSLGHRLLVAQLLVIAAMTITVVGVATLIGPPIFDQHLVMAGHGDQPETITHAEAAFRAAGLTSLGWGLAIAGIGAGAASVFAARRIGRALTLLESAAGRVASGEYGAEVALPQVGRELDAVATTFTTMSQRLASQEFTRHQMLTDLAHELRTPVAAIDLLLEGIEDGVVEVDPTSLATLRQQTARLTRLAGDLSEVSTAGEGQLGLDLGPTPVEEILRTAHDSAAAGFAAAGIRFELLPVEPAELRLDRARIGQVLDNLLRNARQHTAAGGRVELGSRLLPGWVEVSVSDTGRGIAADDLPHVFDRFYRGASARHDEGAGIGVGLAISQAIVRAHGGEVSVTSAGPGKGARFTVRLPRP